MAITVVWDTWIKPGAKVEGLRLTRQVWSEMRAFQGYVSHELLVDQDVPGHIMALAPAVHGGRTYLAPVGSPVASVLGRLEEVSGVVGGAKASNRE